MKIKLLSLLVTFLLSVNIINAQDAKHKPKEEPRGFIFPVEIGQGFTSSKASPPEIYLATAYIKPSYALLNNNFILGATGMLAYSDGLVTYFGGPRVALKIFQIDFSHFGYLMKTYLTGEALWGTRDKKLFGGGVGFVLEPVSLSINARQEYTNKEFWFDASFGLNIDRLFKSAKTDDDPFK